MRKDVKLVVLCVLLFKLLIEITLLPRHILLFRAQKLKNLQQTLNKSDSDLPKHAHWVT